MNRLIVALWCLGFGCAERAPPIVTPRGAARSFAQHAPARTRFLVSASRTIDARLLAPYLPECDFARVSIDRLELAIAEPADVRIDLTGKVPIASVDCWLEGLARRELLGSWKLRAVPLANGVRIATEGAIADGPGGAAALTQRFDELSGRSPYVFVADIAPGGGLLEAWSQPQGASARIGLSTPAKAVAAAQWLTAAVAGSQDDALRRIRATASGSSLAVDLPRADHRLALLLKQELLEVLRTASESMQPTLLPGDNVVVLKPLHDRAPERGDLVAFASPRDESQVFIKRVIGVAGDRVELDGESVRINGERIEAARDTQGVTAEGIDPMTSELWRERIGKRTYGTLRDPSASPGDRLEVTIEPDSVFVLGDNRDNSFDSRHFGSVPRKLLRGRAVLIWLSLTGSGPRWERLGTELD